MVRMVRMVRSLADRTFQLCEPPLPDPSGAPGAPAPRFFSVSLDCAMRLTFSRRASVSEMNVQMPKDSATSQHWVCYLEFPIRTRRCVLPCM